MYRACGKMSDIIKDKDTPDWADGADERYVGKYFERAPDFAYRIENEKGQRIIIQARHMPPWVKVDSSDRSISFILDKLPKEAVLIKVLKGV